LDHFQTIPRPTDEITFESFTTWSALAALTDSTMDSISGGRIELGIGSDDRDIPSTSVDLILDPRDMPGKTCRSLIGAVDEEQDAAGVGHGRTIHGARRR